MHGNAMLSFRDMMSHHGLVQESMSDLQVTLQRTSERYAWSFRLDKGILPKKKRIAI